MKSGILLSVREKATRLPGKVLKPLGGVSITEHLIKRLKTVSRADAVVLATSVDPRDAVLCEIADRQQIPCFRGSKDDKLERYRDAARIHSFDFVAVVDGDDPFVSVEHLNRIMEFAAGHDTDFVTCGGLPLGATGFGVRASALERICLSKKEANTEVWGHLFTRDPAFTCAELPEEDPLYRRPDIRMTLDYEEDYRFFTAVAEGLAREGKDLSFRHVMLFLAAHPDVVEINRQAELAYAAHLKKSIAAQSS